MTLFAQPYNLDAVGFYFETKDEYEIKSSTLLDAYLNRVEEFELMYIDGDDAELFKACEINQSNIDLWFDVIEPLEDREKISLFYLMDNNICDLKEALKKLDDVIIFEGNLIDAATEIFDECYSHSIDKSIRCYIDYEAFARDCQMNGDLDEFNYQGNTYTCTNCTSI